MFFLFHGTDTNKARIMAHKNIEAAQKKHSDAEFFKLTAENFSENRLDELIASQGLFFAKTLVFADCLCDETEIADSLLKRLKEIKESPNFFVFLEGKLNKKELEKFTKYAEKLQEFTKPIKSEKQLTKKERLALKGEKIDFFEFANALGERNKKQLWTLYQEALTEKVPSEEVHGIFFWKVKNLLSNGYTGKYKEQELENLSRRLFNMYHQAHRGETDFAVALERFILEI